MTQEPQLAPEKKNTLHLPHFKFYTKGDLLSLTRIRKFETKMGEDMQVLHGENSVEAFERLDVKYILFGIPEDIGVQANLGVPGTSTAWLSKASTLFSP